MGWNIWQLYSAGFTKPQSGQDICGNSITLLSLETSEFLALLLILQIDSCFWQGLLQRMLLIVSEYNRRESGTPADA